MKKFSFITVVAIFIAVTALSCKKDVTEVQVDKTQLVLLLNQTESLTATVLPDNAANKAVTWKSSHPDVATVTSNGLVTALAPGKVNITVRTEDGNKTATCVVMVKHNLDDPDPEDFGSSEFVSKNPENRLILLEETTGVNCPYCPDGHKRADQLAATHQGKIFLMNIHVGSLANAAPPNDLRTNFGTALQTYGKTTGVPSGMFNRLEFPPFINGNVILLNRGFWNSVANSIIDKPAYVNVAAKTTINSANRTLECKVQVYYTSDAPVAINNINIAVLQNEIIATQENGSSYPERVTSNGKYRHTHVLRHLITGQWGEAIVSDKKRDDLYEKTFTWTIPSDMKNIPMPLESIEILVFVTEGTQAPIAQVCKSAIRIK